MKRLHFAGTYNTAVLVEQIRKQFPELIELTPLELAFPGTGNRFVVYPFPDSIEITLPDDFSNEAAVTTLVQTLDPTALTDEEVFHNKVIAMAQTTAGVKLTDLTAAQIKSLMAIMLYKMGGIDPSTMTVKALKDWA